MPPGNAVSQGPQALRSLRSGLAEPGRLRQEVIPLRDTRRASSGNPVMLDCGLSVTGHFQQMGAHRVETMMAGKAFVRVEYSQQFQSFRWAMHHGGSDGTI